MYTCCRLCVPACIRGIWGMYICIWDIYVCSVYAPWLCVDMPFAADINIGICVTSISPGALFRDQISRMTRDLSRCEHICTREDTTIYFYIVIL